MNWYEKFINLPMRTINIILYSYFIGLFVLSSLTAYWVFK